MPGFGTVDCTRRRSVFNFTMLILLQVETFCLIRSDILCVAEGLQCPRLAIVELKEDNSAFVFHGAKV